MRPDRAIVHHVDGQNIYPLAIDSHPSWAGLHRVFRNRKRRSSSPHVRLSRTRLGWPLHAASAKCPARQLSSGPLLPNGPSGDLLERAICGERAERAACQPCNLRLCETPLCINCEGNKQPVRNGPFETSDSSGTALPGMGSRPSFPAAYVRHPPLARKATPWPPSPARA